MDEIDTLQVKTRTKISGFDEYVRTVEEEEAARPVQISSNIDEINSCDDDEEANNSWTSFNWTSKSAEQTDEDIAPATKPAPAIESLSKHIQKPGAYKIDDFLGSVYDIKNVNIKLKTKQPYDDLFSDMLPVIETTKRYLIENEPVVKDPIERALSLNMTAGETNGVDPSLPTMWDDEQINIDDLADETK
jgi:hypothetical protein